MATGSSRKMNGSLEPPPVEIAITGLSGRFPESDNIEEFKQQLLAGIDMITDDSRRWPSGLHGLPERFGKLKNLSHFDAQHFGVHAKQADQMDPQLRLLLEVTHEAIVDAGINPNELRGTKCGVFMGVCASESLEYWERDAEEMNGYGLTGCSRSMFSNRISYAFDFKGPSITIDTACSSSLYAFVQAIQAIQSGQCDSAIVGGANLLLKPNTCLHFHRLGMLSPEGACRSFDSSANGYVRAESAAAILLQKTDVARRVYASVLGAKTNSDGYKELGITYPSGQIQLRLIQEIYAETGVDPHQVDYLEAHGTGTKVGDPQELNAVAEFFCKNRKNPLLIGSVKSNMGHSEGASGVCSIAKVLIAMEAGVIPKNLHFKNPNPDIPSLSDGRLKVVTQNHPWEGGTVGINSFGFGGANAHVILRSNAKPKPKPTPRNIPRLIGVSGRTEEAVRKLLDVSIKNKEDSEFLSLLDQIHSSPIPGHKFRGYTLLDGSVASEIQPVTSERRPIWYVYPGMGTQWPAMGRDFMKIEPFRRSIQKTAAVLKPRGIDIEDLIVNGNEKSFEDVVNAYVAITAIQIALTDMLKLLKMEPEGLVGHSFGEVGCAYADGCLTAEQAILCTLERGLAVIGSNCPPGSMASVGLTWKEAKERCPPLVYPACHNSENNVTISGDQKELSKFMLTLASEDVFAKEVKSAGFAFHCRHISKAAPLLQKSLENVIPNPKTRSTRWISTSVPELSWDKPSSKLCSPEYFVNNLLSPVLFREGVNHIPKNALIIEIAPTALFQSLLKRTVGPECSTIGLSKRGETDNVSFFISAVGKMFASGAQPCLSSLYGKPNFPVGRGTTMISPYVKWDHSTEWAVASFVDEAQQSGEILVEIDMTKEENKFLLDHKIDGRIIYPGAGYLTLVWKTFAKLKNQEYEKMPVILEDIHLHRPTILSKEETVKFLINIFMGTGAFELREGGSLVASGKITTPENIEKETVEMSMFETPVKDKCLSLTKEDIYKELLLRGYEYSDCFKGIVKCDNIGSQGDIQWNKNWICFIDFVFQFTIIHKNVRDLIIPTKLQKVIIDPIAHQKALMSSDSGLLTVKFNKHLGVIQCGGVEGRGLKASLVPKRLEHRYPKLEKYKFIPYHLTENRGKDTNLKKTEILTILSQIVLENSSGAMKLKMNEIILKGSADSSLSPILKKVLESEPSVSVDSTLVTFQPIETTAVLEECEIKQAKSLSDNVDFAVCHDLLTLNDIETFKIIVSSIRKKGFVLLEESGTIPASLDLTSIGLRIISSIKTLQNNYILLRKQVQEYSDNIVIRISNADFSWVEPLKNAIRESDEKGSKVYLYSEEKLNGVVGMVNTLRKESGGSNLRCIFIQDKTTKPFSIDNYSDQLKGDLVHNVLKNGVWGSYRHLMLEDIEETGGKLVSHAIINTLTRGDLSSLRWIESPLSNHKDIELCHVYYASLNFRDVMLATGKLPPDALPGNLAGKENILGLEYAGRDSDGHRFMGLLESRCLATTIILDRQFCWKVPEKWSLEEAATIPVAYSTAYYSLIVRGNLQPGESVLIHAGSGGVGIASISLALHMGCQVFTTVGSIPKREFLKKTFPELSDKNIGYSRDTSFEQFILSETQGRGVDIVMNSLAADQLYASVRCLANNGRFLEIGKVDLSNDSPLGMNVFLKNISFHGILVDALFDPKMAKVKRELVQLVSEGIENGAVRPLPATVFNENQIEEAFRYMATGQHIGKVVIKIRNEEPQKCVKPIPKLVSAIPRAYMNPEKTYIIVGGLGGFGLELTNWLVNRGATKIVLSSRNGIKTGYQSLCVRKWSEKGVKVIISTEDVTTEIGVRRLIDNANSLGPVGGIFNLAAVLRDKTLKKQTEENFRICCLPKVTATIHLDKVSRETTKDLDYFVTFSSVACGRGNIGQSNYAFANSVMERICEYRRESGLPGLAIQWGAVGDVGLAMELLGTNDVQLAGTLPQRMSSCLKTMDVFLVQSHATVSSFVLADNKASSNAKNKVDLIDTVANILGLKDKNNWPKDSTLSELGMDSLMTAEIKHTLERNFDIILNSAEIRALTLEKLITYESNVKPTENSTIKSSTKENQQVVINIEVMPKKTLVKMSGEDVSNGKLPLFIIHPIEGRIDALAGMAKKIKAPVYGLQCTADTPLENIETLAKFYLEHVKTVQPSGPYTIVGYSFGACVAFEMGIQLEKEGQEVKLWFLDGSPSYVSVHLVRERANRSIEANTDEEQSEALVFFMTQFRDVDQEKIVAELLQLPSWQERLSTSMRALAEMTSLPESELALAASSFFHKIQAADKYKPSTKFRGEVCLLKASENDLKLGRDYGLSEICQQTVKMYTIEGNHTSILMGSRVDKIANILQPK